MAADLTARPVAPPPILEVEGLTKHFPVGRSISPWAPRRMLHAVDDVSFGLSPGTVTALVGESGSGKSTVARLLAQLYRPSSGRILFHGRELPARQGRAALLSYRAQVQMIFQDPFASLNPVKTVEHHIRRPLRIHCIVPKSDMRRRMHELLALVGLTPPEEYLRKYPHQLSGGQRQRVAIARALAVEPQVILADEPISMLDVSIRMGILNIILQLKHQHHLAFLYITHDIASARYVADEVLVMYAGQVVERGETDEVLQHPLHPYTRLLLSAVPNPKAGLTRARVETRGEIRAVIDPDEGCRFAARCPVAVKESHCSTPSLLEVEPGHWVRCHRYSRT